MAAYALAVYRLYGESGPQHRKTMVHVLDLLGCVARGATTEAAIEATPEAIREYLRFLRRHCEPGAPDPRTAFETSIAVHVIEGARLGEGDPDGGFAPDFEPLTRAEHAMYVRRLRWMQDDLVASLRGLPDAELRAKPDAGRPLVQILGHLGGAQYGYLQSPLSKPAGLAAAVRLVEDGPDPVDAFEACTALARTRLDAITDAELSAQNRHGVKVWTARRALRRMLEHQWEHLVEVRARVGV